MSRSSRSLLFSYYLVCFVRVLGKETGTGADNCPGTPTRGGGGVLTGCPVGQSGQRSRTSTAHCCARCVCS